MSPERLIPDFYGEHREIGPLILTAAIAWEETKHEFTSLKARGELLVEKLMERKFFPQNMFIHRHVIPAEKSDEVMSVVREVLNKSGTFVGIRTAYETSKLGTAPWIMQDDPLPKEEFFAKAVSTYQQWMSEENIKVPKAIIVMENPWGLGINEFNKRTFIVRASIIHGITSNECAFEVIPSTDQTRDTSKKIFRGKVYYEVNPFRVGVSGGISWDQSSFDPQVLGLPELSENISKFFLDRIRLPYLLARMEALYHISGHDTIQFQGRKRFTGFEQEPYFNFFLGYNLRGAEELSMGKRIKKSSLYQD